MVSDVVSLAVATKAWCRLSKLSSSTPKVLPHSADVRVEMFCLPNSVPFILNLQRFLVFSQSFAAKAKRQVSAAPAGSLQPDAKRQAN